MTTTEQDAERLAQARQQLAADNPFGPATRWEALTDHERKLAILDAANYLKALDAAGFTVIPPDGAEVREEWGVRWDWNDRDREPIVDWYRDRVMAEGERDRPYREFSATLIRRLHLTLAAEVAEERR